MKYNSYDEIFKLTDQMASELELLGEMELSDRARRMPKIAYTTSSEFICDMLDLIDSTKKVKGVSTQLKHDMNEAHIELKSILNFR